MILDDYHFLFMVFFFLSSMWNWFLNRPLPSAPQAVVFPEKNLTAQGEVMLLCWPMGWSLLAPAVDISQWGSVGSRQALPLCLHLERPKDPGLKTQQIKGPCRSEQRQEEGRPRGRGFWRRWNLVSRWHILNICPTPGPITSLSHLTRTSESCEENIKNTWRNLGSKWVKWLTWSYKANWWPSQDSNPHPSDSRPSAFSTDLAPPPFPFRKPRMGNQFGAG